ncbi:endogenous retrovirus group 3 member 1 Env polyprotein-like [Pituophis catenifer annectens]|uniref:endogenous retrovirus group 3 member 1 Env polyprotein-like n=1 Tax=Pituophis catenifer annectens TaxID=94852 RepID=UPI003992479D
MVIVGVGLWMSGWVMILRSEPDIPMIEAISKENCDPCIRTTLQGTQVSNTLIYHTQKPDGCKEHPPRTCQVNNTIYHMCILKDKVQCYNPAEAKQITTYEMSIYTTECGREELLNKTEFRKLGKPVEITFDACLAINRNCDVWKSTCGTLEWERSYMLDKKYMCRKQGECGDRDTYSYCPYWSCAVMWSGDQPGGTQKCKLENGVASSNCRQNECNPIKITCTPTKLWKEDYGLGIYAKGKDPLVTLRWYVTKVTRATHDTKGLFWSYYLEMEKLNVPETPSHVTNTFVKLAEDIAHTLNVSNCFVCGGTNMGEKWPWEAQELNYSKVLEMDQKGNLSYNKGKDGDWTLTTSLVGNVCFQRKIVAGCHQVGNLICTGKWESKIWWSGSNGTEGTDEMALFKVNELAFLKDPDNQTLEWLAPDGLYWICGKMAYGFLPKTWCGACVLGLIRPGFFLLPLKTRQVLGVPVYDEVGSLRRRRHVDTSAIGKVRVGGNQRSWGSEEWPAERIIEVYGPATWAEDGMYGYRTPMYILNRLIRLQAVVEIITNETVKGLTQLARESVKSRTYIMQNRLALDYLLAKEGGMRSTASFIALEASPSLLSPFYYVLSSGAENLNL